MMLRSRGSVDIQCNTENGGTKIEQQTNSVALVVMLNTRMHI